MSRPVLADFAGSNAISQGLMSSAPDTRTRAEKAAALAESLRAHISLEPPCPMNRLLNERRAKYLIPDEAFEYAAGVAYDRILVWQVSRHSGETKGDGLIIMPDVVQMRELETACLGIIVGAGLTALDQLKSHGIDEGHLVAFAKNIVFQLPFLTVNGKDQAMMVMTAGDIICSCDLALARKERRVRVKTQENAEGVTEHFHIDENGKHWSPQEPFVGS